MPGHYDSWTVFLSFLTACLSGFVAFESVDHTRRSSKPRLWVLLAGITLGLGIWSMHFLGMMAWHPPFPLYYSILPTLISVLVAIGASWLALRLVTEEVSERSKLVGAGIVGVGICAMHYIGMSALTFDGPVHWMAGWVIASLVVAITASWAAIELLAQSGSGINSLGRQIGASVGIGVAICGMHYVGMQAFMIGGNSRSVAGPWSLNGQILARVGVGNAMLITLALLVVSYHEKTAWIQMVTAARSEADRLSAAGKIAASVAHEINNPLEAVTNLLYLAQMGQIGEAEQQYLSMAQAELKRIAAITAHTLKFYRQSSSPGPTSVPELFESALALFHKALTRSGIMVEKQWPDEVPQIVCREGEIRQVIANLVSNAIDAMPMGGMLQLRIAVGREDLEISVSDTGKGITPDVQKRMLEPFFTTKGLGGTGLGLSISAEIVARHGGRFGFTSASDGAASGTRFRFTLPLKPVDAIAQKMGQRTTT
ncbi:MHYT domain-containing protein [Acidicapsa dinghuensis]|uniref:histidine kinase n=1 Tax=Acidicapsa dinghuensis TaxID=2218256 RepID=A0ABW1EHK8_9BACT|nr:MHYT domain-containing protein [Acidicapsa dinghuensis]